jgi:chromate transporter
MTAGIFLPAFAFALLFYDHLERVIEDDRLHRFLEGVAAGVVGLIAVTAVQLGLNVSRSVPSLLIGAALFVSALSLLYVWRSKTTSRRLCSALLPLGHCCLLELASGTTSSPMPEV